MGHGANVGPLRGSRVSFSSVQLSLRHEQVGESTTFIGAVIASGKATRALELEFCFARVEQQPLAPCLCRIITKDVESNVVAHGAYNRSGCPAAEADGRQGVGKQRVLEALTGLLREDMGKGAFVRLGHVPELRKMSF
eukprot:4470615-Amphidinium_carterae.3